MSEEHSAGGIIVHTSGSGWEVLLIRDMNSNWTFPKGLIEIGEDPLTAAKREVLEEVGLTDLTYLATLSPVTYWFVRNGEKVHKTVKYFLFSVASKEHVTPQTEEGITDAKWFVLDNLDGTLGYQETNKQLITETREHLSLL